MDLPDSRWMHNRLVRAANMARVYECYLQNRNATIREVAATTGLHVNTVSSIRKEIAGGWKPEGEK